MSHPLTTAWLNGMLDAGRQDDALATLNAALAAVPDDAALYALRGDLMAAAWRHRDAAADWETALSLDPGLRDARRRLALLEATRPYRLAGTDSGDGEWSAEDGDDDEAWDALERQLLDALNTDPAALADGSDWPDSDGLPDDGDESAFFEAGDEDSIRARGLGRLQQLIDEDAPDEGEFLAIAGALAEQGALPWHALDVLQRGLAAHPGSVPLRRALAIHWMRLAREGGLNGEDVPAGYSADLTGNLFHPVSAATALQLCATLPVEAWEAELHEQRAQIHRLLGDHAAAATDFALAAAALESLTDNLNGDAAEQAGERLAQLRAEHRVSLGGDSALIAARQRQMQETVGKLAEWQDALDPGEEDDTLAEARAAAHEYISTIGEDPAADADYVAEVLAQIPAMADAILKTLETEPYDFRPLGERELFARVGADDAERYLAERAALVRLGYASVGWTESQSLSRRLGRPLVLDLLLSPDQVTLGVIFVVDGETTREVHSRFTDGSGLSHATNRGRHAGWTPLPFREVHLPPETPSELLVRLHAGAVRQRTAAGDGEAVPLHPTRLADTLEDWRQQRLEARLAQGFHDAEVRGYTREHYRVAGDSLHRELADRLTRLRPRPH